MQNLKKRLVNITLILGIIIMILLTTSINTYAATNPGTISSEGAVLLDGDTGQVLYSKNGDTQFYPASTTKVLTALIVLENTKLDDKVTIGVNPPYADGSAIGLKTGEVFTVKELLLGLLLESGNDCAEALAEHVSGSIENFAVLMNKKAKELGATNSNFKNPSGLPDKEHLTTAHDLSLIMKGAINNPDFIDICRTRSQKLSPSTLDGAERWVNNHNYILFNNSSYYYPFSIASKKGYTIEAKFSNVLSAEKNGHKLIVACLKGEDINSTYADTKNLLNYGFDNFELMKIYSEGEEIGSVKVNDDLTVPLLAGKDVYYTTSVDDKNKIEKNIKYTDPTDLDSRSITRGEILTTGTVLINDKEIGTINLASGITREYNLEVRLQSFYDEHTDLILLGALLILILFVLILRKKIRNKKRKK